MGNVRKYKKMGADILIYFVYKLAQCH